MWRLKCDVLSVTSWFCGLSFCSLEVNVKQKIFSHDPLQDGVETEPLLRPSQCRKNLRGWVRNRTRTLQRVEGPHWNTLGYRTISILNVESIVKKTLTSNFRVSLPWSFGWQCLLAPSTLVDEIPTKLLWLLCRRSKNEDIRMPCFTEWTCRLQRKQTFLKFFRSRAQTQNPWPLPYKGVTSFMPPLPYVNLG